MKKINSLIEIEEIIKEGEPVILYFSSKNCSVCGVLKPKVEMELSKEFSKINFFEISCDENVEITSHFGVFSAPTILFYLDGKEFLREGRNISVSSFINSIKRPYKMFYGE